MNNEMQKNEEEKSGTRLLSLDTLRGFDMLFIMGADAFFLCLGGMFPCTLLARWGGQMFLYFLYRHKILLKV